ncbi:MAG: hypothetical protein ACI3U2_02045 [Anaerovibrio sp.]
MSTKKPMVLVIAGPNGSGKSTFTQYFEKIGEYTNADDIVAATGISRNYWKYVIFCMFMITR